MAFDAGAIESTLTLDRTPFQEGLKAARQEARDFARGKYEATVDAKTEPARRKVETFSSRLRRLDRRSVDVDVDANTAGASAHLAGFQSQLLGTSLASKLLNARILAVIGLLPVLAAGAKLATGGLGAMASAAAVAVAAFAAFGVAAVPQIHAVTEALEKGKKAVDQLTPAQQRLARAIGHVKDEYKEFQKATAGPVLTALIAGLRVVDPLLQGIEPLAVSTAEALTGLSKQADKALQGAFWQRFFTFLDRMAPGTVTKLGHALGNIATGIAGIIMAFGPGAQDFLSWLVKVTGQFADWATSERGRRQVHHLMQWIERNGPVIAFVLWQAIKATTHLIGLLANLGVQFFELAGHIGYWATVGKVGFEKVKVAWLGMVSAMLHAYLKIPFAPFKDQVRASAAAVDAMRASAKSSLAKSIVDAVQYRVAWHKALNANQHAADAFAGSVDFMTARMAKQLGIAGKDAHRFARRFNAAMARLHGARVGVWVRGHKLIALSERGIGPLRGFAHRAGGPIRGPGAETSDSVPIWASHNEHMWSAAEVRGAGGHAAVAALRDRARARRLAAGGPVVGIGEHLPPVRRSAAHAQSWIGQVTDAMVQSVVERLKSMTLLEVGGSGPAVAIGRRMAAAVGWTGYQWRALYNLWQRESHWNPWAVNPSSGAYNIPQILPAAHGHPVPLGNARAGIAWGIRYIAGRYGTPADAWAFWQRHHWYDQGGVAVGRGVMPKNTIEPERVLSPRETSLFADLVAALKTLSDDVTGGQQAAGNTVNVYGADRDPRAYAREVTGALDRLALLHGM